MIVRTETRTALVGSQRVTPKKELQVAVPGADDLTEVVGALGDVGTLIVGELKESADGVLVICLRTEDQPGRFCWTCNGGGRFDSRICLRCNGSGRVR